MLSGGITRAILEYWITGVFNILEYARLGQSFKAYPENPATSIHAGVEDRCHTVHTCSPPASTYAGCSVEATLPAGISPLLSSAYKSSLTAASGLERRRIDWCGLSYTLSVLSL